MSNLSFSLSFQALKNGLLIDPHDEKDIADALLKLVSDRNLWTECRKNGLNNINHYSWPQHCRIYLARIAQCRMRHRQWQDDSLLDRQQIVDEDYTRDSLKDVHIHLSIDEKSSLGNGSEILESQMRQDIDSNFNHVNVAEQKFWQRKLKRVFVIAIDSYEADGKPSMKMLDTIQEIMKQVKKEPFSHTPGFILSTALTLSETIELFNLGGQLLQEFDALICGSGSQIYYPDVYGDTETGFQLCVDRDYVVHIGYRWAGQGIKKSITKIVTHSGDSDIHSLPIVEDVSYKIDNCLVYKVKDASRVSYKINHIMLFSSSLAYWFDRKIEYIDIFT